MNAGTGWANVEFRSYTFADEEGDNATIAETAHSKDLRRGTQKPLTGAEQMEWNETAKKTWDEKKAPAIEAKV